MNETQDYQNEETQLEEEAPMGHFMGTPAEFLEKYAHCVICGSFLHFTHVTDFVRNMTEESARCPECGVRPRKSTHTLQ